MQLMRGDCTICCYYFYTIYSSLETVIIIYVTSVVYLKQWSESTMHTLHSPSFNTHTSSNNLVHIDFCMHILQTYLATS